MSYYTKTPQMLTMKHQPGMSILRLPAKWNFQVIFIFNIPCLCTSVSSHVIKSYNSQILLNDQLLKQSFYVISVKKNIVINVIPHRRHSKPLLCMHDTKDTLRSFTFIHHSLNHIARQWFFNTLFGHTCIVPLWWFMFPQITIRCRQCICKHLLVFSVSHTNYDRIEHNIDLRGLT